MKLPHSTGTEYPNHKKEFTDLTLQYYLIAKQSASPDSSVFRATAKAVPIWTMALEGNCLKLVHVPWHHKACYNTEQKLKWSLRSSHRAVIVETGCWGTWTAQLSWSQNHNQPHHSRWMEGWVFDGCKFNLRSEIYFISEALINFPQVKDTFENFVL